ncbi:MAG TPA: hypothetical protein VGH05_11460 [Buttiauxella sp.]|jgi:hypothetical protein
MYFSPALQQIIPLEFHHWQTGLLMVSRLMIPLTVLVFLQTRFGGFNDFDQHFAHVSTDEEKKWNCTHRLNGATCSGNGVARS